MPWKWRHFVCNLPGNVKCDIIQTDIKGCLINSEIMTPKDLLEKWIDAFNKADAETISGLYAEDAINHQVANPCNVG